MNKSEYKLVIDRIKALRVRVNKTLEITRPISSQEFFFKRFEDIDFKLKEMIIALEE